MKKNSSVKLISLLLVVLLCVLTIGFSAFSADMIVNDMVAYIRPKTDVRVTRVSLDDSKSSGYTSSSYNYDVSNITGSFVLDNIGSKITYEIDVTVYEAAEMAIKGISIGENGSGLSASISGYTLKTKICDNNDNSKCNLNATKTMYVTIERTSGNTVNYNNVRIDFDFKKVYNITYVNMNNSGYPNNILDGDDMTINFNNNSQYNGTATYVYNTDTLTVTSYTSTMPSGFVVTGNNSNNYNNNVLTISNVTGDITITRQATSANNAVQVISSLVSGYSSSSTDIINLGTGAGGCTKMLAYDGTTDNNLRYIGDNPCNYVNFSNKVWRIIGVFNNIEISGQTSKETLVKLILNENYGSSVNWNTSSSNVWVNSSLYKSLNTNSNSYYISILNSSSYVANAMWNLGTRSYVTYTSEFYTAERGSTTVSGSDPKVAGYVGLMYPSDYGYATSGNNDTWTRNDCIAENLNSSYWNSDCYDYDWLDFASFAWTISPRSGNNYVFRLANNKIAYVTTNSYTATVRPVIYLKSNVKISSGDGTSGTPYELMQ